MKKRDIILTLVVLLVAGCSRPYSAKLLSPLKIFEEHHQSALDSSDPSWKTEQQLRLLFLDEQYDEDPLTMFHLGRLLSGATGVEIELTEK